MSQSIYCLVVAKKFNDGKRIPASVKEQIESALLNLFGGFSRIAQSGAWLDDGRRYTDTSFRYECLSEASEANDNAIREIAESVKILCCQESVLWYRIDGANVNFA